MANVLSMEHAMARVSVFPLEIPLTAAFANATHVVGRRRICLVRITNGEGVGWGEAAPFPGQDETFDAMLAGARLGQPTPTLAAALDEARSDLDARVAGRPIAERTIATLPICAAIGLDDAVRRVGELVEHGVARFKVKVAPTSIDHLVEIREQHPGIVIGVDGNGSFGDLDRHDLGIFHEVGLAFAEELFGDWTNGTAEMFTDMTGVPLFADESVRSVDDAAHALSLPAVGGITVKPGRLGWQGAREVAAMAQRSGKLWRGSSLLETSVGRSFTAHLAADPDAFLSDAAPASLFLGDDVVPPATWSPEIVLPTGPGIGVDPDLEVIERRAVGEPIEMSVPFS